MKTLDEVRDRCIIIPTDDSDDGNEHWIFQGSTSQKGVIGIHAPDFTRDPSGQLQIRQTGRRAVRHIATGKPIPKGWRVWSRCQVPGCVNPACIGCGNLKAYGQARRRSGVDRGQLKRVLANLRNSDLRRKVTRSMADDILRSNDTSPVLGLRLGIDRTTVQRVRRGQTRIPGNPFQGLSL